MKITSLRLKIKLIFRFFKVILTYPRLWFLVLVLNSLGVLLSLVNPYLSKLVIDDGLVKKDFKVFIFLVFIGAIVYLFSDLIQRLKHILGHYFKMKIDFQLNKRLFGHLQGLSLSWFKDKSTGEHIYKFNYDIDNISILITDILPEALFTFLRFIFILAILFYLNWKMAFLCLGLGLALYFSNRGFTARIQSALEGLVDNSEAILKGLQEFFSHIQLVKAFGREEAGIRVFLKRLLANIRINLASMRLEAISGFISEMLSKSVMGLIVLYAGYQVIRQEISLGGLTAIMAYLAQLISLEGELASFFQRTLSGVISCERIAEVLDEKSEVEERPEGLKVIFKKVEVVFKQVSFGYDPKRPIFNNISFNISAEGQIALAGPSGCGKTTLLYLILRLYDPWSGGIFIDGYDIKDIKLRVLKEQIGFSMQEPMLWNDTLSNNISYAKEGAKTEEIIRVAKLTGVDEFAKGLALGYDTIIGENACKLSEGQKQKVAIARALIKDPKVLILDEAMASMDSLSEEKIISNIRQHYPKINLIVVSHRLSTAMNMDLVYYLSSPEKIIIGQAKALIRDNPGFSRLFGQQDQSQIL